MDVTLFEIGDIVKVRLNNSSPLMSVRNPDQRDTSSGTSSLVDCIWFNPGYCRELFHPDQLELVTSLYPSAESIFDIERQIEMRRLHNAL